eukprot:5225368-Pyramimonas_sp.AAC.2
MLVPPGRPDVPLRRQVLARGQHSRTPMTRGCGVWRPRCRRRLGKRCRGDELRGSRRTGAVGAPSCALRRVTIPGDDSRANGQPR